ncbi:hypothetical protein PanWU01x14_231430 [Parasponia andersonii]|uniref:DUF4220 domain-containing protein n=1 Tax=Parasponia andersonii TaxID=3476 RepID=A0A2P5BKF7_PARAD|nr:hypothetical protein PanWU01x14_231430 [Parasponia andersonii]
MSTEGRRTTGQAPDDQVQEAASSDTTMRYVSSKVRASSRKTFLEANHTSAFKVIEYELSILYEVLHTKVVAAVRTIGFAFRFISFCIILGASLLFSLANKRGDDLDKFDIGITYALLIAAIVLDCASFVQLLSSDSTLGGHKGSWRRYIPSIIVNRRRWSESVFQYNMISYCLDESPMRLIYKLAGYFHARGTIDKLKTALFSSSAKVTEDVKAFVFNELKTRTENAEGIKEASIMVGLQRGHYTLISYSCIELHWSVKRFQYPETLLLWHIATELCYDKEVGRLISTKTKRICKLVSDYMFYLLVMQPSMFSPVLGNWNVVFQDTCAEAKRFFDKHKKSSRGDPSKACEKILSVPTSNKFAFALKGFKRKSLLFDACVLAKELQKLEYHKWEVMDRMWVELMSYAAINRLPIVHAQQPSKGGELWTFTWLLMNDLGLGLRFAHEDKKPEWDEEPETDSSED